MSGSSCASRPNPSCSRQPAYWTGSADPDVLSIPSDGTAAHLHHVLDVLRDNGLQPERVSSHRPTLDDVFLALTA